MPDLVAQPTGEPTRKTMAVGLSGGAATAASIIFGWIMRQYAKVEVPGEVEVAVAAVLTYLASYFTRERSA